MWLFFPLAAADQNLGVRSWANASGQVAWTRLDFAFGPDLTLLLYLVPNVPLQYSCLQHPMDRGAWWTTVHRVAKSLKQFSTPIVHYCETANLGELL